MKNLLLLLLIIFFTSCNTNYNNALKYLETATQLNSQDYLDDAKFEYNLIDESRKSDDKVIELLNKITNLQNRIDSISYVENQKRLDFENKLLEDKIEKEKEKIKDAKEKLEREKSLYPNLVGKWRTYQTNYLSMFNGIVRIYKKNGSYFYSKEFSSGSREYTRKLRKSGNKYYEVGKSDYVIIKSNGDLEHRDKEGYLMTSKKFDKNFTPTFKKLTRNINTDDIIGKNIFEFRFEYRLDDFKTKEGTNNQKWITYYPKYDLTLTSNKQSDQIEDFKFGD